MVTPPVASDGLTLFFIITGALALVVGLIAWVGYFLWVVLAGAQDVLRRRG